jgi:hypothetical protein
VPITDVAAWLGHRNINVTYAIFGHLVPSSLGRAQEALNAEYAEWSEAAGPLNDGLAALLSPVPQPRASTWFRLIFILRDRFLLRILLREFRSLFQQDFRNRLWVNWDMYGAKLVEAR